MVCLFDASEVKRGEAKWFERDEKDNKFESKAIIIIIMGIRNVK